MRRQAEVEIEVRYAETDQMGIVHHSNYLVWLEVARTRLCEEAGLPYASIEEAGHWLVVTGASLRYRSPARYGQRLTVTCELAWLGSRSLVFRYVCSRGAQRLATGETEHVWVDKRSGRNCRIPQYLEDSFLELCDQKALSRRRPAPTT